MKYVSPRVIFYAAILVAATLVLVYPPVRLAGLLFPGWTPSAGLVLTLFGLPMSLRLLHHRTNLAWSRAVAAVVMTWLGICFMMFCLLVPAELLLLAHFLPAQQVGYCVFTLVAGISLYSVYNAMRLHVHEVDLAAPESIRGMKLVQISDVHIGSRQPGFLAPIVARVNALNPDYTLITGDLIDMHGIGEESLTALEELDSTTLFCIGNHERYCDTEDICNRLTNLGIEVLRNVSVRKNDVQFIGIDDAERRDQVSREIGKLTPAADAFRILLYHRPDGASDAAKWGADLMLTGHTHRGQIFPFNLIVKRFFSQLYQNYNVDGMTLYVSPGTGTWGPVMRLGSKCEITLFRLV